MRGQTQKKRTPKGREGIVVYCSPGSKQQTRQARARQRRTKKKKKKTTTTKIGKWSFRENALLRRKGGNLSDDDRRGRNKRKGGLNMAGAVQLPNKNILQQTNNNVPVIAEMRESDGKAKTRRRFPQETENRAVTSRLRRVRLDVSSQGLRGECYRECSDGEFDEEEDEEDEVEDRKQGTRPIIPNYVTKSDKGQYRKRRKSRSDALDLSSQREGGRQQAASVSIAKRNARERNRVKLVNQGFATLRSRIPDYISEMYTEERKKKKVSKVETLRMAVGYIRHLTDMLELRTEWFPSGSSTGYPSPIDTDYQESPSSGAYSRDPTLYDYDLELETVKDIKQEVEEEDDGNVVLGFDVKEEADKDSLLLEESAFSVSVGCCYDLDKPEAEERKTSPLPSITESFPKKSLRAFYDPPSFLSASSTFHL